MTQESKSTARRMVWGTRLRKGASGFHLALNILLLVLLWAMINFLGMRNYVFEDWSAHQSTALSDKTLSVIESVEEPVEMILLLSPGFQGAAELEDLAREFQRLNKFISVKVVDPDRDIAETEALRNRFQVSQPDQVLLSFRDRKVVLSMAKMLVMESEETRELGQEPRMIGFRGEAVLSSGLMELTRSVRPVVYFLTGHGEKEIDNFEQVPQAYSTVREKLEADNIEVRTLNLEETRAIPEDTDLLVIAGPRTRISQPELDLLRAYMTAKGRLLVAVDAGEDAGLIPFLKEFGIQLLPDVVVDPVRTLSGEDVNVSQYSNHPITDSMQKIRSMFIRPRSVLPALQKETAAADRPQYSPLMTSSPQGWAETRPNERPYRFDENVDMPGPVPIAAAVEWKLSGEGAGGDAGKRLVVFGDSLFAGNWLNNGGGILLMQNAVNWLLYQEELLEIPPKDVTEIRLQMDKGELYRFLFLLAVVLPGAVMGLGAVVFVRRRK